MQESYETVISLAEEIAISWPRITAFTETRGRRGLAPGLEMEPEQGQLAPLQGQAAAAAAAAATAGSSEEGILPDFRRQLGVILQTVGKAQVEKMLRELVKEQEQQGRVRRRKRVTRSPRLGAGDEAGGQNNSEASHAGTLEAPTILSRKPVANELQVPLLCPGLVAGQKQPISGKIFHGDARGCKNSLVHQQSPLGTRWGAGLEPRETVGCSPLHSMSRDSQDAARLWPPFGERAQFFSAWQKPRFTQRRRRPPAGEKPHRCGPCRRTIVVPPQRSSSPPNSALAPVLDSASASSLDLPLNSVGAATTQLPGGNSVSAQPRKPHGCEECGKRFRILANLERHQQRHAVEKPHQCRDCGRRFRWGCHLERHRRSRRCVECGGGLATPPPPPSPPPEPDRPYSCGECGRRFTQRSALSKHRRLHSGERPYGCGECGKRFLQRSDLTIHVRSHSGEQPYVCTECGRRFSVSSNLSKHRRMHRGERPHACSVCAKRFLQRSELLIHQRAHTGERPYPCTACGKRFARRAHLKRHQRTHGSVPAATTASRHQSARLLAPSAADTTPLLEHEGASDALESRPCSNTHAAGPRPPASEPVFSAGRSPVGAASLGLPWAVTSSARLPFCSSSL
uniref:endothelial zinc finger protein induced by tumor necrosis factor alpha-like isoform X1 n=1 Tax=Podarcis muralis TaxID=64176 RepID=UPI00109F08E5|nr:endothelial zinc finger protein induced by tumor necrosis factor alpha-like isoform X1 [Podarcis muralis]XP_028558979.1 endothelial zinc finger protein induced by tumor necrosis factor alpha-like isoform X1 [Podarcis muralis]XP_028558980.1 endothelial zinc finger protein induced by tumor necrosis factor alpha-like isoform X1 [Podarcis muralis]